MLHHIQRTAQNKTVRQFVKFSLVGVVNTLTNLAVYLVGTRVGHLPPLAANAVAFVLAVTVSFILNRHWTFRGHDQNTTHQYTKFMMVNLVGFGWSELILYIGHHRLGWNDLVAYGVSVILVLIWNFSLNKLWTFRPTKSALV